MAFLICKCEKKNIKFAVDPWIFPAYHNSWLPDAFPSEINKFLQELNDLDFVLITHIHDDHFDPILLEKICNSKTKIIMPKIFGYKLFESKLSKYNLSNKAIILDCLKNFEFKGINITPIPPMNTSGIRIEDISESDISIDGGFLVESGNLKLGFLAENNPYNMEIIEKTKNCLLDLDLLAISHSGFASDYPFNYYKDKEKCLEIYSSLEKNRQESQLKIIKTYLKPKNILAYSSSFALAKTNKNWEYCAKKSLYFEPRKAAEQFYFKTNINSFGLNLNDVLHIDEDKSKILNVKHTEFRKLSNNLLVTEKNKKRALEIFDLFQKPIIPENDQRSTELLIDQATHNYFDSLKKFDLKPKFNIEICTNSIRKKIINKNAKKDFVIQINIKDKLLRKILLKKIHWDEAMLTFEISYLRIPDSYCKQTYLSIYNFVS